MATHDDSWNSNFEAFKVFCFKHARRPIHGEKYNSINVGLWYKEQITKLSNGKLRQDRLEKLKSFETNFNDHKILEMQIAKQDLGNLSEYTTINKLPFVTDKALRILIANKVFSCEQLFELIIANSELVPKYLRSINIAAEILVFIYDIEFNYAVLLIDLLIRYSPYRNYNYFCNLESTFDIRRFKHSFCRLYGVLSIKQKVVLSYLYGLDDGIIKNITSARDTLHLTTASVQKIRNEAFDVIRQTENIRYLCKNEGLTG